MLIQILTALKMFGLKKVYAQSKTAEPISTHRTLVIRALPLLYSHVSEAAEVFEPMKEILDEFVTAPDRSGDHEKGTGRHYYNATNFLGVPQKTEADYYRNGKSLFSKSARTMLEEDYTMAITMYKAGFTDKSAEYLARAIHMVSDMSCLPHAVKMTYRTPLGVMHSAYEDLAGEIYPDAVPPQEITADDLKIFECRENFSVSNKLVEAQIADRTELPKAPFESVRNRLYSAEKVVAALLYRFWEDISLPAEKCFRIESGAMLKPRGDLPPFMAKVTEDGIRFYMPKDAPKSDFTELMCSKTFRAAHRKNGLFTLSPTDDDPNGRCVVAGTAGLIDFDPRVKGLQFKLIFR